MTLSRLFTGTRGKKKQKISNTSWKKKMKTVKIDTDELNKLVLDYLIIEGYADVAKTFIEEAEIKEEINQCGIDDRVKVRNLIQEGNIADAIEKIKDIEPEILNDKKLYFQLKQQEVIELIRIGKIEDALKVTQTSLTPQAMENEEYLNSIEQTMSLLTFDDKDNPLLHSNHKFATASKTNAALLKATGKTPHSKLVSLLNLLDWSQERCSERIEFPKITDFSTGSFSNVTKKSRKRPSDQNTTEEVEENVDLRAELNDITYNEENTDERWIRPATFSGPSSTHSESSDSDYEGPDSSSSDQDLVNYLESEGII